MSLALLNQIVQAENEADEIIRDARKKAREMIRSAEDAALEAAGSAENLNRNQAERALKEARLMVDDEIKALEVRYSAEHAALRQRAMEHVDRTARWIYERILEDVSP